MAQATVFQRARKSWERASLRRKIVLSFLAFVAFVLMTAVGLWTRACANDACPAVESINGTTPDQASKVYAADGQQIYDFGLIRRTVVSLSQMSPAIPAAFIAVEDKRFYQHHGVDWVRFFGSIKKTLMFGGLKEGFSTITMQLAGNLWPEEINRQQTGIRGIPRKIREVRVAMAIEKHFSKRQILELYLNNINLGNSSYGVESAAHRYFGKSSRDLNIAEAAMLAAIPKAPDTYNPRKNPRAAVERRNVVIDLMREDGQLTREEAETWKAYPLALSARSDYSAHAEYFYEYVRQLLTPKFGKDLYKEGLRIYTTLDIDAQVAAERALEAQLERIENDAVPGVGKFKHQTYRDYLDKRGENDVAGSTTPYLQGAVLVMEAKTGNILAMVAGRDFNDSKFNRIVQAERQPGSSFKPIMYTAALEGGTMTFDDQYEDKPIAVHLPFGQPDWEPHNYGGRFSDSMLTVREGLYRSLNSIAVQVGLKTGIESVRQMARRFGLTTPIDSVPSIFLGSPSVKPIELISGYSTFANLGTRVVPNAILRVEDKNGKVLYRSTPDTVHVLDPVVAYTMTRALQGVVTSGTANATVWRAGFQLPAGGKTGTTNDGTNVWFIGFTRDLVAGVWMGFDNPAEIMKNAQGGLLAAPAWTQMMLDIYQRRRDPGDWSPPAALQALQVDKASFKGGVPR